MDFPARVPPNLGQGVSGKAGWNSYQVPLISGDGSALQRDDVLIPNSGGVLTPRQMSTRRLAAAFETLDVAYASATELAVAINRIGQIVFEYYLIYGTTGVGNGIGVQLAFTGVAVGVRYTVDGFSAPSTRENLINASAFGSGVAPYAAGPGAAAANACAIRVSGSAVVSTVGTLNLQTRTSAAAQLAGLYPGSYGQVWATD